MTREKPKPRQQTAEERDAAHERSRRDDPTRETRRQLDDNQDDMGRDANDPRRVANEINRTGH